MTKQEKIDRYNSLYPKFNITNIKKMTSDEIKSRIKYGARSLDDCYQTYSEEKRQSYAHILETYNPRAILAVMGSSFSYSVLLVAWNGDVLLITQHNNYLVEEVEA